MAMVLNPRTKQPLNNSRAHLPWKQAGHYDPTAGRCAAAEKEGSKVRPSPHTIHTGLESLTQNN